MSAKKQGFRFPTKKTDIDRLNELAEDQRAAEFAKGALGNSFDETHKKNNKKINPKRLTSINLSELDYQRTDRLRKKLIVEMDINASMVYLIRLGLIALENMSQEQISNAIEKLYKE